MPPVSRFADCAGLRLHYRQWGPDDGAPVVLWHGVSETGQVFAAIARALGRAGYRALCPDQIGRGLSQWANAPAEQYRLPFYAGLQAAFLDALAIDRARFLATSVGGHYSILSAGGALRGRISHLVLNDVGSFLPAAMLARIVKFLSAVPVFAVEAEAEAWWRRAFAPGGPIDEADWPAYLASLLRRDGEGRLTVHFDPKIVFQLSLHPAENTEPVWPAYARIAAPVLLIHGAASAILSAGEAAEMTRRGRRARLLTIPGCGHAPALNTAREIEAVLAFFTRQ